MTMPNPVAEVVERLDVLQEIDAAIEDAQAGQMEHDIIVTLQLAKAEIERLSRAHEESEARLLGALQRNLALRVAMQRAAKIIKTNLYHQREKVADAETILLEALEVSEPAAAPQPPTVSPDIVALTRERDQLKEELARTERNRDMWKDQCARQADLLSAINELPQECVNSLTHQRQIDMDGCEVGVSRQAVDEIHAALKRARSVLHPEKED